MSISPVLKKNMTASRADHSFEPISFAGKDNLVYQIDTSTLILAAEAMQLTKPSVIPVRVEPLQGCHLVAAGTTKAGQTFMCAAASDRIW